MAEKSPRQVIVVIIWLNIVFDVISRIIDKKDEFFAFKKYVDIKLNALNYKLQTSSVAFYPVHEKWNFYHVKIKHVVFGPLDDKLMSCKRSVEIYFVINNQLINFCHWKLILVLWKGLNIASLFLKKWHIFAIIFTNNFYIFFVIFKCVAPKSSFLENMLINLHVPQETFFLNCSWNSIKKK